MLIFLFSLLKGKMEIHFAFACVGNKDKIKTARGNRFLRSGSCPYPDIKGKKYGKKSQGKQPGKVSPPNNLPQLPTLVFGLSIALRLKSARFSIPLKKKKKKAPINYKRRKNQLGRRAEL